MSSLTDWNDLTTLEGVSRVARDARARGLVCDDAAFGVGTARSGTRVDALHVDTGSAAEAVAVDDALGPAVGRHADHVGQAGALSAIAVGLARGVWPAGRWHARFSNNRRHWWPGFG